MSKAEDVYNYRKDTRSDKEFEYYIRKLEEEEEKYLRLFVEVHNKRRKKREITVDHWGNDGKGKIVTDLEELKGHCRPDYIMNRCYDNSYFNRVKQPIEVQTCKKLRPDKCYIKKSKIDWPYDNVTKEFCTDKTSILFILGTKHKGLEKYALLSPNFLEGIKKNGITFPNALGGKPSYFFNRTEKTWKLFNGDSSQQSIDLFKRMETNKK